MSVKLANRVLDALDLDDTPSAADLVISNRIRAFQKAKVDGDLGKMLDSAKAVIKAGAETPGAEPLFKEMIGEIEDAIDEEDDDEDGRDAFGRVIRTVDQDDEDFEDDNRDMFGRVIR